MRRGFTLIELLVVIAIIAILAAILFPVFAKAREKARQTSCLSNTRQICTAMLSYVQDYDEKLPGYRVDSAGLLYWDIVLQPYVKNTQLFKCPSLQSSSARTTYGYNYAYLPTGLSLGSITSPSETILLADGEYIIGDPTTAAWTSYNRPSVHNEGANYALMDGHAKWYSKSAVQGNAANLFPAVRP